MAKRKRLTAPNPDYLASPAGLETKALGPLSAVPIAEVARDAAAHGALETLSKEVAEARAGGRMVVALPLDAVEAGYLVRDRMETPEEDLAPLIESLRARGQQVPIEVVDLGDGRYGLISGWRRLTALRRLADETGEDRFASIAALLRTPESAAEAYVAMVEENEIRVGLSYYERARIVARAVEVGVYPTEKIALQGLFASASRARRSKIGSFLPIYKALDRVLVAPCAIPERLGLALAKALDDDPTFGDRLATSLRETPRDSPEAELRVLEKALAGPRPKAPAAKARQVIPGVKMQVSGEGESLKITLTGDKVTRVMLARIESWLKTQG